MLNDSDISSEIESIVGSLTDAQVLELRDFQNDKLIKNIHLTLEDVKTLATLFDENRGSDWAEQPQILDHFITYLRQLKSVKNLVLMLKQLDNISCSLILILADEIRMEYIGNLKGQIRNYFETWYSEFIPTVCTN